MESGLVLLRLGVEVVWGILMQQEEVWEEASLEHSNQSLWPANNSTMPPAR